jgi:hypothetical protein
MLAGSLALRAAISDSTQARCHFRRPLCKFDLANQLWLYPMASLKVGGRQALVPPTTTGSRYVEKGTTLHLNLAQVRVYRSISLNPVPTLPMNLSPLPS